MEFSVNRVERKSYPLRVKQMFKSEADKQLPKKRKSRTATHGESKQRQKLPARRNKDKNRIKLSPELVSIKAMLVLLKLSRRFGQVGYLAMDGDFRPGVKRCAMMPENNLHPISKLRKDAAIYEK